MSTPGNYRTRAVIRHYVTHDGFGEYPMRKVKSFATALAAAQWLAKRDLLAILVKSHNPGSEDDWTDAFAEVFPPDPECDCCQVKVLVNDDGLGLWPEPTGDIRAFCLTKHRAYLKAATNSILAAWKEGQP